MNLSTELQKILGGKPKPNLGTIVYTSPTELSVRTRDGLRVFPRTDATAYKVGDKVRVKDGVLSGRLTQDKNLQEYIV